MNCNKIAILLQSYCKRHREFIKMGEETYIAQNVKNVFSESGKSFLNYAGQNFIMDTKD